MDNRELLIEQEMSVIEAMKILDRTAKKILFVVDEEDHLLGTITDGDIRRFIINNGDLHAFVTSVMNNTPHAVRVGDHHIANLFDQIPFLVAVPVLNEQNKIVEIVFRSPLQEKEQPSSHLDIPVVIMAGGEGKRLLPYTRILPKPLIPIGDVPIVERIINNFYEYGMHDFHLVLNYKKNMVISYFNDMERTYNINYVEETEPLGTVGGLVGLKGILAGTFFVSNCDVLVLCDYADIYKFHKEYKNDLTVVTSLKSHKIPYGVIEVSEDGTIKQINEKPTYNVLVNTGMYICESSVIDDLPLNQKFDMTDLIDKYIKMGKRVGTYPVSEDSWLDMGEMEEMDRMLSKLEIHRFST